MKNLIVILSADYSPLHSTRLSKLLAQLYMFKTLIFTSSWYRQHDCHRTLSSLSVLSQNWERWNVEEWLTWQDSSEARTKRQFLWDWIWLNALTIVYSSNLCWSCRRVRLNSYSNGNLLTPMMMSAEQVHEKYLQVSHAWSRYSILRV